MLPASSVLSQVGIPPKSRLLAGGASGRMTGGGGGGGGGGCRKSKAGRWGAQEELIELPPVPASPNGTITPPMFPLP